MGTIGILSQNTKSQMLNKQKPMPSNQIRKVEVFGTEGEQNFLAGVGFIDDSELQPSFLT